MPKLNCCVENCAYNNDKYCCVGAIDVDGVKAVQSDSTCCNTFLERSDAFTNCACDPNPEIDIDCEAKNCMYNDNCKCHAEKVDIDGDGACNCHETKCSTFCCK